MKKKNIIVTGGSGFIGSELVRTLSFDNKYNITNIDNLSYSGNNLNLNKVKKQNYKFIKLDIKNYKKLSKCIYDLNPDIIFHLAAQTHVDRSIETPSDFVNTNILGTFNLIESCRGYIKKKNKKDFKFIHISTDEVYGSLISKKSFNEQSPYNPSSPYSASKASSDHLVSSWSKTFNFPAIITHTTNNFGPYQFPEKFIPVVILSCLRNLPIPIYGKGKQKRDWIFVSDNIEALLLISHKGKIGQKYCISSGYSLNNLELANKICNIMDIIFPQKYKHRVLIKFVEDRPAHDFEYALSSAKLKSSFNWTPKTNFDEGLEKTVRWYIENQDWCKKVLKNFKFGTRLGL